MKMVLKAKKEAPAPPKAEAKVKALKAKKASVERCPQPQKKRRSRHQPPSGCPGSGGSPNIPGRAPLGEATLTTIPSSDSTSPRSQPGREQNSLWTSRPTSTKLNRLRRSSVTPTWQQSINTLIRPDRQKKAYVPLAPGYDALDIADKIGII